MNEARGRPLDVRSPIFVAAAAAGGVLIGMAGARTWLPLLALIGGALLAWFSIAPVPMALGVLLAVRGLTDSSASVELGGAAGLNPGSLLGLFVMVVAAMRLLGTKRPRGLLIIMITMLTLAIWTLLAVARYGASPVFVQEFVRTGSIIAVGLIAANPGKSFSPSQIAAGVVIAAIVPAILVVGESGLRWGELLHENFRPRGTISHPNAASIFFSVALVMAVWKRVYGGGGRRYILAGLLLLVAILATKSIGGLMQTVSALGVFVILQRGNTGQRVFLGFVVFAVLALFVTDPLGLSRVEDLEALGDANAESSATWRLDNWSAFLEVWRDEPILGFGLGSTRELIRPLGRQAHNEVIRVLVETGVVGLLLVVTAYAFLMGRLLHLSRVGRHASFVAAVLAAFIGITLHALVTDAFNNTGPMYLVAALVGTALAASANDRAEVE